MNISFSNSYPKRSAKTGKLVDVFVYHVKGTAQELADYKKAKGEQYREDQDSGHPLFYSVNYVGENCPLIITTNGNVVADTSMMRKANNLIASNSFLKDEVSRLIVEQLGLNRMGGASSTVSSAAATQVTESEDVDPFKED